MIKFTVSTVEGIVILQLVYGISYGSCRDHLNTMDIGKDTRATSHANVVTFNYLLHQTI